MLPTEYSKGRRWSFIHLLVWVYGQLLSQRVLLLSFHMVRWDKLLLCGRPRPQFFQIHILLRCAFNRFKVFHRGCGLCTRFWVILFVLFNLHWWNHPACPFQALNPVILSHESRSCLGSAVDLPVDSLGSLLTTLSHYWCCCHWPLSSNFFYPSDFEVIWVTIS